MTKKYYDFKPGDKVTVPRLIETLKEENDGILPEFHYCLKGVLTYITHKDAHATIMDRDGSKHTIHMDWLIIYKNEFERFYEQEIEGF